MLDRYGTSVSIAAVNGPAAVTLPVTREPASAIAAAVEPRGIFNRVLQVEVAYHSPYMDPLRRRARGDVRGACAQAAVHSALFDRPGRRVEGVAYEADYWWHNVRRCRCCSRMPWRP